MGENNGAWSKQAVQHVELSWLMSSEGDAQATEPRRDNSAKGHPRLSHHLPSLRCAGDHLQWETSGVLVFDGYHAAEGHKNQPWLMARLFCPYHSNTGGMASMNPTFNATLRKETISSRDANQTHLELLPQLSEGLLFFPISVKPWAVFVFLVATNHRELQKQDETVNPLKRN